MSDIQIIKIDPDTGLATVEMSSTPKKLVGLAKLIQIVVLEFLKNPGRDVFNPEEGSGLRADIGQYNFIDGNEIRLRAVQRATFVEKFILDNQPVGGDPTEKLKKLMILDVGVDASTASAILGFR